jgi:hypothetical protein
MFGRAKSYLPILQIYEFLSTQERPADVNQAVHKAVSTRLWGLYEVAR